MLQFCASTSATSLTIELAVLIAGVIDKPKAILGVSVVLLFRYRGGVVVFDDVELIELDKGICNLPPESITGKQQ